MARENLGTDINGKVDFSLNKPVLCEDIPLTANVIDSVTTPPEFNRAFFSYAVGTDVWVTFDGTDPVVPAVKGSSTQELTPSIRKLDIAGGQTIKMISDTVSFVNIRYDLGASNV